MKKLMCVLLVGLVALSLAACTDNPNDPGDGPENPTETFEEKIYDGIGAVFDESMGYYNEHPSAFQEGTTRWLFYTRNTVKYDDTTDSIAVRKGTYSGRKVPSV